MCGLIGVCPEKNLAPPVGGPGFKLYTFILVMSLVNYSQTLSLI